MAVDGGDVKFTFSGDSSQLRDELDALSDALQGVNESGQGAANALDDDLGGAANNTQERFQQAAGDAAGATKSTAKYGEGLNKAGNALTNAAGAVCSVASVIGHFNPEVAESVRVLGDMTNSAGQLMKAMAQGPVVFAAAATAAAVAGVGKAINSSINQSKKLDKASFFGASLKDAKSLVVTNKGLLRELIKMRDQWKEEPSDGWSVRRGQLEGKTLTNDLRTLFTRSDQWGNVANIIDALQQAIDQRIGIRFGYRSGTRGKYQNPFRLRDGF